MRSFAVSRDVIQRRAQARPWWHSPRTSLKVGMSLFSAMIAAIVCWLCVGRAENLVKTGIRSLQLEVERSGRELVFLFVESVSVTGLLVEFFRFSNVEPPREKNT